MATRPTTGRRPGRPIDTGKRAAVLAAAQRLFLSSGFAGTSMDAVAEAAGVSKLTAYKYFGSKQELFATAVAAKCESAFVDIDVEIETDRIYTSIGSISPEQRRYVEEMLSGPIRKFAHVVGGAEAAERYLAARLEYLDRADTSSITAYWIVKGRVP